MYVKSDAVDVSFVPKMSCGGRRVIITYQATPCEPPVILDSHSLDSQRCWRLQLENERGARWTPPHDLERPLQAYAYLLAFTASLSVLLALKPGVLVASILIFARVCGFTPSRAWRWRTSKVPKPVKVTFSPFFSDSVMTSNAASTTCLVSF